MASRVNVRFVVILSVVLVALFGGVAFSAYKLLIKSADDHAVAGDKAMAKGDLVAADMHYSKAVDKDKTNPVYLRKWRDVIEHQKPDTQVAYVEKLNRWFGATRQLAIIQRDNVDAAREYLDARKRVWLSGRFDRQATEQMIQECDTLLAFHEGKPAGPWEALRRYRGFARVRILAETPDAKQDLWDGTRADLEAALKADPADSEAALSLQSVIAAMAARAEKTGDAEAASRLKQEAAAVFPAFLAAHPDDPSVQMAALRQRVLEATAKFQAESKALADAGKPVPDPQEAGKKFFEAEKPAYEAAFAAAAKADPSRITTDLISAYRTLESALEPQTAPARTQELVRRLLDARPNDVDLIALRADLIAQQQNFPDAVAQIQPVLDMPPAPVSIEGSRLFFQKTQARFLQTMWSLRAAMREKEAEPKKAAIATAKSYLGKLTAAESADSPQVQLAQAWMAFLEDDMETSDRLFDTLYKAQKGMDTDSMMIWATVAIRRQQPGAARDRLQSALQYQPQNIGAAVTLAELSASLRDYATALSVYEELLKLYPGRKDFQERVEFLRAAVDPTRNLASVTDPVAKTLLEMEAMARKDRENPQIDRQIAEKLVQKCAELNYDPRLVQALVMTYMRLGESQKAKDTVARGVEKNPDNKVLKNINEALGEKDDYQMRRKLIDLADAVDLDKVLGYYQLAREFNRPDDVKAALARMGEIAPDDPKVVEVQFLEALEANDAPRIDALAQKAVQVNADRSQGKTFLARAQASKGDFKAAAETMTAIIDAGGAQPEMYRLRGRFYATLGRTEDAVTDYRFALAQRPNDPGTLKDLISGLVLLDRSQEALTVARNGLQFGEGDREYTELWLRLEQQIGDIRRVRDRRERIALVRPNDRDNLLALGDTYLRLNEVPKAEETAARLDALGEGLDSVGLKAAILWTKVDRAGALAVYTDYAKKQTTNPAKLQACLAAAQFLYTRKDLQNVARVLEAAREFQDPKTMEADKALADAYVEGGNGQAALEPLRRVLAANADTPTAGYRKRLVETLMAQGQFADAEKELAPLLTANSGDVGATLLQAAVRGGLKDYAGQRRILDQAVSRFPKEPAVFIKRGQLLAEKDETLRDAIADYTTAITLAPNMWQPYRLRAAAYAKIRDASGGFPEVNRAIDDLTRALERNPYDNDLLVGLVSDLLRQNRDQEAQKAVEMALKARPRDAVAFVQMGNLFHAAERPLIAQEFFRQAFALDKQNPGIVQRLLDSYLDSKATNIGAAEDVLTEVGPERLMANPGFLMAQAKIHLSRNKLVDANTAIVSALRLLDPRNVAIMYSWDGDMRKLQPNKARYKQFLETAISQGAVPAASDWLGNFRAMLLVEDPATFDEGASELTKLAAAGKPDELRLVIYRNLGGLYYGRKDYANARRVWTEGITSFPNDAELNNNLAFLLVSVDHKPAEALPFAQKAVEADPTNADIEDTLGFILMATGDHAQAAVKFREAMGKARSARSGVLIASHLMDCLLRLHDASNNPEEQRKLRNEAQDYLSLADQIVKQAGGGLDDDAKAELEKVRARLGKP